MAYDVLDNVYSIFMDVKTGVGGSSGSNTFYNTDVNTSFIEIILTERDKNLTMTDYTYIVSVDKADGTSYVNRYTASEANKMSIKLDTQLLACEGECTAQLYVLKDDKVRTMMEFNYFVKNGVFDGAKPPSHNEDSIYISLMKEFTDLKENVLIAIGKMDGIESSIESVKNIADTNTNTINSEKKKTEANTSTIEGHTRSISEINNTLQTHSDKIQASEETITQHTEKLQGHDSKLEEYNTTIQEHGRTLESQGASITEQGEKISKNETDITQNKKDIEANTAEINKAKTATTGEKFGSVSERIDAEVSRINNKIEVSFVPQEEAESHTILNTVEGMSTDMVVKGKTLQNIFPSDPAKLSISSGSISDGLITINAQTSTYGNMWDVKNPLYKTNTKYSVIIDILENTLVKGENTQLNQDYLFIGKSGSQNDSVFSGARSLVIGDGSKGRYVIPLETISDFSTMTNNYGARIFLSNVFIGGQLKLKIMILEGDWTNKPIPEYFEGIKSFGQKEGKINILSSGKNLCEYLESGGMLENNFGDYNQNNYIRSNYINIKGIESLSRYLANHTDKVRPTGWYFYDNYKNAIKPVLYGEVARVPQGAKFVRVEFNSITPAEDISKYINELDFIVIESDKVERQYSEYKSDKKDISLSKYGFEEGLRGLNNTVYDELNSVRDVAVKRIDKRTFTGDENWKLSSEVQDDFICFYIFADFTTSTTPILCNNFIQKPTMEKGTECVTNNGGGNSTIRFKIQKSKLTTLDVEGFKAWLKANPTTVYFELAEPIETPLTDPINVKTFNEKTYVSFLNSLKGTSSFKTPVDTIQTIARLTSENKSLLSSNVELGAKVTEAVNKNQQLKEEAIATQSALDYILMNTLKA